MILCYMLLIFITLNVKHYFKLLSFVLYMSFTRTQGCWHAHTKQKKPSPAIQPADWSFPVLTYYCLYSQMCHLPSALSKCCSNRFPTTLIIFFIPVPVISFHRQEVPRSLLQQYLNDSSRAKTVQNLLICKNNLKQLTLLFSYRMNSSKIPVHSCIATEYCSRHLQLSRKEDFNWYVTIHIYVIKKYKEGFPKAV